MQRDHHPPNRQTNAFTIQNLVAVRSGACVVGRTGTRPRPANTPPFSQTHLPEPAPPMPL